MCRATSGGSSVCWILTYVNPQDIPRDQPKKTDVTHQSSWRNDERAWGTVTGLNGGVGGGGEESYLTGSFSRVWGSRHIAVTWKCEPPLILHRQPTKRKPRQQLSGWILRRKVLVCGTNFLARTMPGDNHLVNPSFKLLAVVFLPRSVACASWLLSHSLMPELLFLPVSSVFF